MKKICFLVALIVGFSIQSQAQINLYDSLKNDLTTIVKTLEGPTKQVYELHKKEVIIGAWGQILVSSVILGIFTALTAFLFHKSQDDSDFEPLFAVSAFLVLIILATTLICIGDGITDLMNVDYHAMKMLVDNIRG